MNNITNRIMNAIVFGGNDRFDEDGNYLPRVHPLYKTKCLCGEWVREKDRAAHLLTHIDPEALPRLDLPSDEEINAMYAASVESEVTEYRHAH